MSGACIRCGGSLPRTASGQPRKCRRFCSGPCKAAYHRARRVSAADTLIEIGEELQQLAERFVELAEAARAAIRDLGAGGGSSQ